MDINLDGNFRVDLILILMAYTKNGPYLITLKAFTIVGKIKVHELKRLGLVGRKIFTS
jgi:hypothetical protein